MGTRIRDSNLLEWPLGSLTSGGTIYPGYSYELAAAPSGAFYTLEVGARDYSREFGVRVIGTGTLTITSSDPAWQFLQHNGTASTSLVLREGNALSVEYRILDNIVRPMRGYVLGTGGGGDDGGDPDPGPTGPWTMKIGSQGWFHTQQDAANAANDSLNWSGDDAMVTIPAINWTTAYGSPSAPGEFSATNIWRPETLALWTQLTGPIRFMDWGSINYCPVVEWADRVLPTQSSYDQYGAPDSSGDPPTALHVRGMAPEWMIDLCNRTYRDMWICVPHLASDAYVTALATLIKAHLDPSLKVYIEYSNETWNFGSGTLNVTGNTYTGGSHRAQADHIIMAGVDGGYPGDGAYYKGYSYHCARSYQLWYLFAQVFVGDTDRLINTICVNGNIDLLRQGLIDTYGSSTYNPHSMPVHLICTAPYIDGQTSSSWQENVDASLGEFGNAYEVSVLAETYDCQWGCYEGGMQAAGSGCDVWSEDPDVYDAYLYLYNKYGEAGCSIFCHYTLIARRSPNNAWGLLDNTNEPLEDAHRWRATVDWIESQMT